MDHSSLKLVAFVITNNTYIILASYQSIVYFKVVLIVCLFWHETSGQSFGT